MYVVVSTPPNLAHNVPFVLVAGLPRMVYHDNRINFKVNHAETDRFSLSSCEFTIDSFSISDEQDPEGRIEKDQKRIWFGNSQGYFSFSVGRHGTFKPATFWFQRFKKSETSSNDYPDDLNFAFVGPLEIVVTERDGNSKQMRATYVIANFGFAQGKVGLSNNWWVAAHGGSHIGDNQIVCEGVAQETEKKLYFTFRRGDNPVDVVDITHINSNPNVM